MTSERAKKLALRLEYKWEDLDEDSVAELINAALLEERREACKPLVDALEKAKEQLWHPAAGQWGEDAYRCNPSVCPACIVDAALEKVKGENQHC